MKKKNSGDCNSGNRNSGDCNSGNRNSGDCNSGYGNSGNGNSGNRNSGDCNSGNYNLGNHNSGFFNTIKNPTVMLFNKNSGLTYTEVKKRLPIFSFILNEYKNNELITYSYKEAWANAWAKMSDKDKQKFYDLPNFDADIFKEITGIDVNKKSCDGKIVEIDGKKYKLTEVD